MTLFSFFAVRCKELYRGDLRSSWRLVQFRDSAALCKYDLGPSARVFLNSFKNCNEIRGSSCIATNSDLVAVRADHSNGLKF
jgi:hypothetical protein